MVNVFTVLQAALVALLCLAATSVAPKLQGSESILEHNSNHVSRDGKISRR